MFPICWNYYKGTKKKKLIRTRWLHLHQPNECKTFCLTPNCQNSISSSMLAWREYLLLPFDTHCWTEIFIAPSWNSTIMNISITKKRQKNNTSLIMFQHFITSYPYCYFVIVTQKGKKKKLNISSKLDKDLHTVWFFQVLKCLVYIIEWNFMSQ